MTDIFELLLGNDYLDALEAKLLRQFSEKWNVSGYEALIQARVFDQEKLCVIFSEIFQYDRIYFLQEPKAWRNYLDLVPFEQALQWGVFLVRYNLKHFEIALYDPTLSQVVPNLKAKLGEDTQFFVIEKFKILDALYKYYPLQKQLPES